jgi:uncharacterized membrane protein
MTIKTFFKLRLLIAALVGAIVAVSVSINNAYLSIAGVLIGILFMVLVRSRVKGILVDERVISVSGRASSATYAVGTVFFAALGMFLLISSKHSGDLSTELIGTVLCYAAMLLVAVYTISYHYLNRKYGGRS